ncbi:MAG: sulfotransferase [Candidatus Marinimicrobia bacterium]|nr:sulfotransferase [Candidatus Neomarinimicrobiota bacterium]
MKNKSLFLENEKLKTTEFKKNDSLDELLNNLSNLLKPVQKELNFDKNRFPLGFIVGNPRSGTSLLLQWLGSLNVFSYPTNVLTRFAYSPYIGALIQKILFDPEFDFHGEFHDIQSQVNFSSTLGKSKGALAASEFQHFFRNYMENFDPEYLDTEQIKHVDFKGMNKALASIESAFGRPFVTKLFMLQFNICYVANKIPNSIFLYAKREPIYIMQSILLAREKYYGKRNIWLSVKPKEYNKLITMDVYNQIAGQVYYTDKSIAHELSTLSGSRKLEIQYEAFCSDPKNTYEQIIEKYNENGLAINVPYNGPESFTNTNIIKLPKEDILALENAFEYFENNET